MDQITNTERFKIFKDCKKSHFDKELNFDNVLHQVRCTVKQ